MKRFSQCKQGKNFSTHDKIPKLGESFFFFGTLTAALSLLASNEAYGVPNPCFDIGSTPTPRAARAGGANDLFNTCGIIIELGNNDAGEQLTPLQVIEQNEVTIAVANQQFRNVKSRLMQLRHSDWGGFIVSGIDGNNMLASNGLAGGAAGDKEGSFDRLGVFMNGNFAVGDKNRTARELGFEYDNQGSTVGVDYRFTDNFLLGTTFGYNAVNSDFDAARGGLSTDGYSFSLYSTYYRENFYVDSIFSGGWNEYDTRRNIRFPGFGTPINQTAQGVTQGNDFSFNISSGYDFQHRGLTYGPYGRVSYQNVQIDSYQETPSNPEALGAGSLLTIGKQNSVSLQTALGGQLSYAISLPFGVLRPTARAEWIHEFHDGSRPVDWRFSNDPAQTAFAAYSDNPDRNYGNMGAGFSANFVHGVSAFMFYEAMVGRDNLAEHSVNLGVRGEF